MTKAEMFTRKERRMQRLLNSISTAWLNAPSLTERARLESQYERALRIREKVLHVA